MSIAIARTPVTNGVTGAPSPPGPGSAAAPAAAGAVNDLVLSASGPGAAADAPKAEARKIMDSAHPNGSIRTAQEQVGGASFLEAFFKTLANKSYDRGRSVTVPQLGEPVPQAEKGPPNVTIDPGKPSEAAQLTISPEFLKSIGDVAQVSILGLDKEGRWAVIDTARKESSDKFVFSLNGASYTGSTMVLIEPKNGSNLHMPLST